MGYQVKQRYRKKNGTIIWRILYETFPKGKKQQRHIPKQEWPAHGFQEGITFEDAKDVAKQINAHKWLKYQDERNNKIRARLRKEDKERCALLPVKYDQAFEHEVLLKRMSGGRQNDRFRQELSYWRAGKRLIRSTKLHPSEWSDQPEILWHYFIKKGSSPSHVQKILRRLNLWGQFFCKRTNKPFLEVKYPRGTWGGRIWNSFYKKRPGGLKSKPLEPQHLEHAKSDLMPEHYNWLYIALWFGLRPSEVDGLKNGLKWTVTKQGGIQVLSVDQPKLIAVDPEERFKLIPLIVPQQTKALEIIQSQNFKRPGRKVILKHLGERVTTYCGRKGFTDYMIDNAKKDVTAVASWLGHSDIKTTLKHYKNRRKVRL